RDKEGLGVANLYALNRGLMFKWIWRFYPKKSSLWTRVIKAIHGDDGKLDKDVIVGGQTCWTSIVKEAISGDSSSFWEDKWYACGVIKELFPRLYALELHKHATVRMKLMAPSLDNSFRRRVRSRAEESQFNSLLEIVQSGFSLNKRRNLRLDSGFNCGFDCCSSGSDGGGDGREEGEGSNESNLATVSKEEESGSSSEGGTEKPVSVLSRASISDDEYMVAARDNPKGEQDGTMVDEGAYFTQSYDTQDPAEDEQHLNRVRDWIKSYHLDDVDVVDALSAFPDISLGLLAEHQRRSKVSEATAIRSSDSTVSGGSCHHTSGNSQLSMILSTISEASRLRTSARQAKAVKDLSRPAGKLHPQDGRISYEEFQVRMKEGTDWRKVSLGKCLLPYSDDDYILFSTGGLPGPVSWLAVTANM
nr:RNA-directed DNA polymerase, eukaryota, reverse transcriptase zinc-binding domain protein [Tanacetum cinerariifolium]